MWAFLIALGLAVVITILLLLPGVMMGVKEDREQRSRTDRLRLSLSCPICGGVFKEWQGSESASDANPPEFSDGGPILECAGCGYQARINKLDQIEPISN